jgi:hypothetical protein
VSDVLADLSDADLARVHSCHARLVLLAAEWGEEGAAALAQERENERRSAAELERRGLPAPGPMPLLAAECGDARRERDQ